ncbi:MAG TPA: HEAT repeat domain-containing protein [Methanomicrobiales archaeon]|nr:HEAT repeat domain-containing protein [Methanomicrobiales archaeon]
MIMAGNGAGGDTAPGEGIYSLIESLGEQCEYAERIRAAKALGESRDPRAISPLVACLKDVDPRVRRCCAEALLELGSIRSVPAFTERLEDREEAVFTRKVAADALAKIRSYSAIESLVGRLLDPEEKEEIRVHAADALGRTGSLRAIDALEKGLGDPNPRVKHESGKALQQIFAFGEK